jgi:hypothetical protein
MRNGHFLFGFAQKAISISNNDMDPRTPSPEEIVDIILSRRDVYGLDVDSRIREASNNLTARAFFEVLARIDMNTPHIGSVLSDAFSECRSELIGVIGFATPQMRVENSTIFEADDEKAKQYCLKLIFSDEQAAFYQEPLFPDLSADYVLGATRKSKGPVQHLRITLSSADALQTFMESCHANPFLLRVETSTDEEFERAILPS